MRDLVLLKLSMVGHLKDIANLLPDTYKLTLVARNTEDSDAHILIGDDHNIGKIIKAINKVAVEGDVVE